MPKLTQSGGKSIILSQIISADDFQSLTTKRAKTNAHQIVDQVKEEQDDEWDVTDENKKD